MPAKLWTHHTVKLSAPNVLDELAEIPGVVVRLHEDDARALVEVPWTAAMLAAVHDALGPGAGPHMVSVPPAFSDVELTHLRPYQRAAVAFFTLPRPGGILADAMGLGKTRTAAFAAARTAHMLRRLPLIVAPKYLRTSWEAELRRVSLLGDGDFIVFEGRTPDGAVLERADRAHTRYVRDGVLSWGFIHYDIAEAWSGVLYRRFGACIIDEGHIVKNPRARRTKAVHALALSMPWRLVLTGTPMPNRPQELWSPLTLACGARTWGSVFDFRRRYCGATPGDYGWVDTGPTHVDELHERLSACYLRRTPTSEGVTLPALTRMQHLVDIDDAAVLRKIDEELVGVDLAMLGRMLRAGAIGTEYLRILARVRRHTTRAKLPATVDLVLERVESDSTRNVVVFAHERATVATIARTLRAEGVARLGVAPSTFEVTGDLDADARARVVDDFQAQPGGAVLVATYGSLSVGVSLTSADTVVLHDLDWVPATLLQAEARIHRVSQTRPCFAYWVVARDGVDPLIADALVEKARNIAETLEDGDAAHASAQAGLDTLTDR